MTRQWRLLSQVLRQPNKHLATADAHHKCPHQSIRLCNYSSNGNANNWKPNKNVFSEEDKREIYEIKAQMHEWSACNKRSCDPEAVTPEQWRYILSLSSRRALKKEYLKPQTEPEITERKVERTKYMADVRDQCKNGEHIDRTSMLTCINRSKITKTLNMRLAHLPQELRKQETQSDDHIDQNEAEDSNFGHFQDSHDWEEALAQIPRQLREQQLQTQQAVFKNINSEGTHDWDEALTEIPQRLNEQQLQTRHSLDKNTRDWDEALTEIPQRLSEQQLQIRQSLYKNTRDWDEALTEIAQRLSKQQLQTRQSLHENTRDWDEALTEIPQRLNEQQRQRRRSTHVNIGRAIYLKGLLKPISRLNVRAKTGAIHNPSRKRSNTDDDEPNEINVIDLFR